MRSFELLSGHSMPIIGFGTARLFENQGKEAIKTALRCGVRQIDCAKVYGNEALVGNAIHDFLAENEMFKREDLFITSKIWNDDKSPEHVEAACRRSLKLLGLDYLDLYLIHWPLQWKKGTIAARDTSYTLEDTWRAMERLVELGLVKSIGVSNFGVDKLKFLLSFARIKPAVNQIELHPLLQQNEIVNYCRSAGILVTAWSPIGKFAKAIVNHPIIVQLSKKYKMPEVSIILGWHIARGVAVIPRSKSPEHIRSNCAAGEVADKLEAGDIEAISSINRNKRLMPDIVGIFDETPYLPWGFLGSVLGTLATAIWFILPIRLDVPYTIFKYTNPKYLAEPNRLLR